MSIDGQNIRLRDDDAAYLSFSPDGTQIIFTRSTRDAESTHAARHSAIWAMNRDGSDPHRRTDPEQPVRPTDWLAQLGPNSTGLISLGPTRLTRWATAPVRLRRW
ncbi:hypothetical protein GCM10023318_10410 [Nocardia callitridis]|uniref:Dipeptidylpeptidase IV N-terminal domain-containing protein n=1 Tax=Nocardia callitridis TaxID=648753 RepID=A0ABP9JVI6_9NOCA